MAYVDEEIVRLFFEFQGFLVRTNVKYMITKSGVPGESDVDLVVANLHPDKKNPPREFVLRVEDLKGIEYAAVEVKGWHTITFTQGMIRESPPIFNFVRPEAIKAVTESLGTAHFSKILVISQLPKDEKHCAPAIEMLRTRTSDHEAIDHVIEFTTILEAIVKEVEPNKSYRDSECLETVRLLKRYRWLKPVAADT